MIWRSLAAIALLLMALSSTLWLNDFQTEAPSESEARIPDYELEDAEVTTMDEMGHRKYRLQAPYMAHYIDEKRAHADSPTLWYYRTSGVIRMQADEAEIIDNGRLIHLKGKVNLHRPASGENTELTLQTSEVWVRLKEKTAITRQPVMAVGERYTVTGRGASLSLESDVYRIHAQAESVYEPL